LLQAKGENVRKIRKNGALAVLAAAAVMTALMFGSVATAHATPISRAQAVLKAKEYLRYQAFSLKGLVGQLKYEGFSTYDATYGATYSGANWMTQAVKKAKEYLRYQAFSRSGLIAQLEYEGFTPAQALHGVLAVGL
jgi:hypothetical protein